MGIQIRPNKKWRQVWRYEDNCFSLFYNSLKKNKYIWSILFKHWKIIIWNFFDNLQVNILKNRKSFVSYIKHYMYIDIPTDKTIPKYVIYKICFVFFSILRRKSTPNHMTKDKTNMYRYIWPMGTWSRSHICSFQTSISK